MHTYIYINNKCIYIKMNNIKILINELFKRIKLEKLIIDEWL